MLKSKNNRLGKYWKGLERESERREKAARDILPVTRQRSCPSAADLLTQLRGLPHGA